MPTKISHLSKPPDTVGVRIIVVVLVTIRFHVEHVVRIVRVRRTRVRQ